MGGRVEALAEDAQEYEVAFWGDCANTYGEEAKQLVMARLMGLPIHPGPLGPAIQMVGGSVLDVGGGPVSLLLKTTLLERATVADPAPYPEWVTMRYAAHDVVLVRCRGEDFADDYEGGYDEAWIYNVLQHVDDPARVIAVALAVARRLRLCEWVDIPAYPGHPHELSAAKLREWIAAAGGSGEGRVTGLNEDECVGRAFHGVFEACR